MPSEKCTPQYFFNKPFKIKIPERSEWVNGNNMFKVEDIAAFTDKSQMYSGAGAGIYSASLTLNLTFPLGNYTTVYQAGTFAIIKCV